MKNILIFVLVLFLVFVNILRFQKLDDIPHGFHVDEYAAACSLQCVSKTSKGVWGAEHEVFVQQGFGTPKPPNYFYPALLWSKVFGYLVPSIRALSVLVIVFGVGGLFLLGSVIGGFSIGLWTAVAATISPWSWVLGRVGWESFFAPVAVIWGLYFFFRNSSKWNDMWAGLFFCMGVYFYPPARIFMPIFICMLFAFETWVRKRKHFWWILAVTFIIFALPLIQNQIEGRLNYRVAEVAIWNSQYLSSLGETNQFLSFTKAFLSNYLKHFDFHFLFITGDSDLKHSTQKSGILSWLDILAWLILIGSLLMIKIKFFRDDLWKTKSHWLIFCFMAFFVSVIPSGLTFLGTPNALRICMGWPFVCVITGITISWLCDRHFVWIFFVTVLIFSYAFFYLGDYFNGYKQRSEGMFAGWTYDESKKLETPEAWMKFLVENYDKDFLMRYYLMNNLKQSCSESYQTWQNVLNGVCHKYPTLPRCGH